MGVRFPPTTPTHNYTGDGRRYGRTKARKLFTNADLATAMAGKVWLADRAGALLDDIDQVMADQADPVAVLHTLHQVLNYKGT